MNQRQAYLLRMRDFLENLHVCHQQMEFAEAPDAVTYLTETMLRNLDSCRRLCQNLHRMQALEPVN
jgi:hypothetical protein